MFLVDSVLAQHTPRTNIPDTFCDDCIEVSGSQVCYLILQLELQPLTSSWVLALQDETSLTPLLTPGYSQNTTQEYRVLHHVVGSGGQGHIPLFIFLSLAQALEHDRVHQVYIE